MKKSLGTLAFKIHVAVSLLLSLTLQIKSTGAIPGDEFEAANLLYNIAPALSWIVYCTAAAAIVALLYQIHRGGGGLAEVLTIVMVPFGFFMPLVGFAVGLAFLELAALRRSGLEASGSEQRPALLAQGETLAAWGWKELLQWWTIIALPISVGALVVTGLESFVYSADFSPELFDGAALASYRLRLLDLSVAFGVGMSLFYLVPMLLAWVGLRLLKRAGRLEWAYQVVALSLAGLMIAFTKWGLWKVVGDEIVAVGLSSHILFYLSLVFLFWFHSVQRVLLDSGNDAAAVLWCRAVLGLLGLPASRLPRILRDHQRRVRGTWVFVAAMWLFVLVYTSYPELEDFRSKLIALGVVTAIHVIFALQIAILLTITAGRMIRVQRVALMLITAGLLCGFGASLRPISGADAQIVHEYARFGYIIKRGSLRDILHGENRTGYEASDGQFDFHGAGDERYPEGVVDVSQTPPIFMVLWDAARPDHMSCYGYSRVPSTTPHMDRVAQESVVFEKAYSAATATTCGVRHLYTGNYSTRYMLAEDHDPFFVHALRKHGYRTFYITAFGTDYNGVSIDAFQRNAPPVTDDGTQFLNLTRHPQGLDRERPDSVKAEKMMEAWRTAFKEKGEGCLNGTFSFLHLTGTHFPWKNDNAIHDYGQGHVDLYDGETLKCDALTGRALDVLREIGAYDDAIIIHLADHGTGLFEHGRWAGFLTYEEQTRIPLIIKMPGVKPRRVSEVVGTIDIAPTLVGLFEPGASNPYDGVSLLPLMTGEKEKLGRQDIVSMCSFEDAYSLIHDRRWKLHFHRAEDYSLLFDLQNDPEERVNLIDKNPAMVNELMGRMGAFLWRGRRGYGNPYHYRDWTPPR